MCVRVRIFLLGFVPIAAGLTAALPNEAKAQVDPNIQSRIETFSAPFAVQPLRPQVEGSQGEVNAPETRAEPCIGTKDVVCLSPTAVKKLKSRASAIPSLLTTQKNLTTPELVELFNKIDPKSNYFLSYPINVDKPKKPGGPRQPTAVKFSFPINPTYETNVLKTSTNPHQDTSIGFGGGVQVLAQGLRDLDIIAFSAGTGSARFSAFPSKSFDSVTAAGGYQYFLAAYDKTGGMINTKNYVATPQNLITIDTLTFAVQNVASYAPTFRNETVDFLTPSIAFGRQNIPIGASECAVKKDSKAPDSFCSYADVTMTAGQTFSDITSQANANFAASGTLGYRFPKSDFTATWITTGTAKSFENVSRNDFQLQTGPKFIYSPSPSFSTSLQVSYYENYSSLATARWHGFIIQPIVTIAFLPPLQ